MDSLSGLTAWVDKLDAKAKHVLVEGASRPLFFPELIQMVQ